MWYGSLFIIEREKSNQLQVFEWRYCSSQKKKVCLLSISPHKNKQKHILKFDNRDANYVASADQDFSRLLSQARRDYDTAIQVYQALEAKCKRRVSFILCSSSDTGQFFLSSCENWNEICCRVFPNHPKKQSKENLRQKRFRWKIRMFLLLLKQNRRFSKGNPTYLVGNGTKFQFLLDTGTEQPPSKSAQNVLSTNYLCWFNIWKPKSVKTKSIQRNQMAKRHRTIWKIYWISSITRRRKCTYSRPHSR